MPNHRIIIVDDEPESLKIFETYLKAWNFEVDAFTDPVRALSHFKENASSTSLVVTDIRMPNMSGIELAQEILRLKSDMKIILMTAFQIDLPWIQIKPSAATTEDDIVLRKPFDLDELCKAIRKQLHIA